MDESVTAGRHAGECQSSPLWAWSRELATAALLCSTSSIFHSERFQNLHLLYLPPTAQQLDLTPHCHLDHFQPPLSKPSSLYRVSPLFIYWVSKCDFLDLALTVHIHWASLNMLSEYQSRKVPLLFAAIPTLPKCSLRDFHFALVPLWAPIEFWVNLEGAHPCHLTLLPRAAWGRLGCRASSGAGWPKGQLLLLLSSPPASPSGCPYLPVPTALWALLYSPSPQCQKNSSTLHISPGRTWHQDQVRKTCSSAPRDSDMNHLPQTGLEEAARHWVAQDCVLHAFQVENNQQEYGGCSSASHQWTCNTYQW